MTLESSEHLQVWGKSDLRTLPSCRVIPVLQFSWPPARLLAVNRYASTLGQPSKLSVMAPFGMETWLIKVGRSPTGLKLAFPTAGPDR